MHQINFNVDLSRPERKLGLQVLRIVVQATMKKFAYVRLEIVQLAILSANHTNENTKKIQENAVQYMHVNAINVSSLHIVAILYVTAYTIDLNFMTIDESFS